MKVADATAAFFPCDIEQQFDCTTEAEAFLRRNRDAIEEAMYEAGWRVIKEWWRDEH